MLKLRSSRVLTFAPVALCLPALAHAQTAAKLWQANCIVCHGETGSGGGAGARSLLSDGTYRDNATDLRFFNAIKEGSKLPDGSPTAMPAFSPALSDAECWSLVVHIRELQAAAFRKEHASRDQFNTPYQSAGESYSVIDVVDGLDSPWAIDFLPTKQKDAPPTMLITERPGTLRVFENGKLSDPVKGTPSVFSRGQAGLLDVAVHPDYANNGWVYLAFSHPGESVNKKNTAMTNIVRGHLKSSADGWVWTDQETLWAPKPEHYMGGDIHFGCRIVIAPPIADGPDKGRRHLYFCIGERGRGETSQDFSRPNGKVHRIFDDGSIPSDNPFVSNTVSQPDAPKKDAQKTEVVNIGLNAGFQAYSSMWSFGHRNPQGLTLGLDGQLWNTEHGPRGGDELNAVTKAGNFGWPIVSFGINYNGTPLKDPWGQVTQDGTVTLPVYQWTPSIAACGLDVVRPGPLGEAFPKWKGHLVAGGLAGAVIERLSVQAATDKPGYRLVEREELVHGVGRVRDVVCGPDGSIYAVINDPHKVIRLIPTTTKPATTKPAGKPGK